MLFSMLANLAEDRQGRSARQISIWRLPLQKLTAAGVAVEAIAQLLDHSLIVPVLTAHPTEVMRKSMLDHRNRIAELMALRDGGATETPNGDVIEQAIVRQIALLWQTRPLRRERMQVRDEVEIALAYLRDVFLPVLPQLYSRWDRLLPRRAASFLRLGSWIGGDRDGNPNVGADSLKYALGSASRALLNAYLAAGPCAGQGAVGLDRAGRRCSLKCVGLADASGDDYEGRRDEPYRRALTGIYARLAATYQFFTGQAPARLPNQILPRYASPQESAHRSGGAGAQPGRAWRGPAGHRRRAGAADTAGGSLRISSCHRGPAAELRCACAGRGRAAGAGGLRRLSRHAGGRTRAPAAPRARWARAC